MRLWGLTKNEDKMLAVGRHTIIRGHELMLWMIGRKTDILTRRERRYDSPSGSLPRLLTNTPIVDVMTVAYVVMVTRSETEVFTKVPRACVSVRWSED